AARAGDGTLVLRRVIRFCVYIRMAAAMVRKCECWFREVANEDACCGDCFGDVVVRLRGSFAWPEWLSFKTGADTGAVRERHKRCSCPDRRTKDVGNARTAGRHREQAWRQRRARIGICHAQPPDG